MTNQLFGKRCAVLGSKWAVPASEVGQHWPSLRISKPPGLAAMEESAKMPIAVGARLISSDFARQNILRLRPIDEPKT
jgi:hypothetical protein